MNAENKVRKICRDAVTRARGDTTKAYEIFNLAMIEANSAELERELCSAYRATALRAWIAEAYQALRSEGKIPRTEPHNFRIKTLDYDDQHGGSRPLKTGDLLREAMQPAAIIRRYLDSFKVNGEPIGDCTAEVVLKVADNHERDARFMRYLASGIPPTGKIRDYRTEEEAAVLWEKATNDECRTQ